MNLDELRNKLQNLRPSVVDSPARRRQAMKKMLEQIEKFRASAGKLSQEVAAELAESEARAWSGLGDAARAVTALEPFVSTWKAAKKQWLEPNFIFSNEHLSGLFARCGDTVEARAASARLAMNRLGLQGHAIFEAMVEAALESRAIGEARRLYTELGQRLAAFGKDPYVQKARVRAALLAARIAAVEDDVEGVLQSLYEAGRINAEKEGLALRLETRFAQAKELAGFHQNPEALAALAGKPAKKASKSPGGSPSPRKAPARKATARKAPARKAPARKAPARKATARKAPAKR